MFEVKCPHCSSTFQAQQKHVGKKGKCPKCKESFTVDEPRKATETIPASKPVRSRKKEGDASGSKPWFQKWATQIVLAGVALYAAVGVYHVSQQASSEPEKSERQKRIEGQFSLWDGSHNNLVKLVKESMNDPESFEHIKTVYFDRGDFLHVRTEYRGKNAFGGIVKDKIVAKVDLDGNIIQILELSE